MTTIPEKVNQAYGALPTGWRLEKLKFFADVRNSNVDKTIVGNEELVRLCNYTDVYYNDRITPALEFMEGSATEAEIERFQLKRGQVIITKDSEGWDDIGIPALITEDMPDVLCGYHLSIFEPGPELDGEFLAWLCRSEPLNNQFKVSANGVTRFGLGQHPMKNAFIALPCIETQRRIAQFLNEKTARIDGLIEKKRALLDRLAEKRQALITRAVTKGLDPDAPMKPSGIDWLGEIPAHWEHGNIRRFGRMKTGHTPSRSNQEYWEDCTIPWFTLADVWQLRDGTRWYLQETTEKIGEIGLANSAAELLPAGTVVFSRTASVGYSGIMPETMATSQDFWNWICGPKIIPEYLLLLFRSMTQKFEESTRGSTHKTIYQGIAAGLEICVPRLGEQREIADFVFNRAAALDQVAVKIETSVDALIEYRSALSTAAVTGKLAIPDFTDVVVLDSKRRAAPDAFKRAVFAAKVADRMCDQPAFGRVKFQKVLHLGEAHLGIHEVSGNYHRHAAGPHDPRMIRSVESQLAKQGWIATESREGGKGTRYRRGHRIGNYQQYFDRYWPDCLEEIEAFLDLLSPMRTRQAEIVSTAYAAWNDLLLEGKDASDDAILTLIKTEWHESKARISENRWRAALGWMREKGLVPKGTGSHTKRTEG